MADFGPGLRYLPEREPKIAMIFRNTVVMLTLLSFTACTTMQPMEDFSPSKIRDEVEVGDRVEIIATTGMTYDVEVLELGDTFVMGRTDAGKRYKIQYEAIKTIRVAEVSPLKTVGGIGVTLYVVLIGLFIAWLASLDDVMSGC